MAALEPGDFITVEVLGGKDADGLYAVAVSNTHGMTIGTRIALLSAILASFREAK